MAPDWSRRELLKTAATGATALGLGAVAYDSMDRYIVGATDGDAVAAAAGLSDGRHTTIDFGPHGTLVAGVYSSGMRQSFLSRDDVSFVQPDRPLSYVGANAGDGEGTLPWGIDRVDADVAHDDGATGEGVDVGIIDGGIAAEHPDLRDNVADPDVDGNHRAWAECSGEDCTHPWDDDGDHGTHVSGTVAATADGGGVVGVAPGATLHALKVCGAAGRCRTSHIAEAIKHAADQGWDVVNLSLGSPRESPALQTAGEYALDQGVLPVAAAGNSGPCSDCVGYPAAYEEFLAVSATTIDDAVAEFSSTGSEVDVAAPGKAVCSAVVDGHGSFDGTSMATPHVVGAAAQLMAQGLSATAARERLVGSAEDLDAPATDQGAGLVDVAAALGLDSSDDGTGDGTSCPS